MRTSHKMYLTFVLSTACIFLYQYQLSKARLITSSSQQSMEVFQMQQSQLLTTKLNKSGTAARTTASTSKNPSAKSTTKKQPKTITTLINSNRSQRNSIHSLVPSSPLSSNSFKSVLSSDSEQSNNALNSNSLYTSRRNVIMFIYV